MLEFSDETLNHEYVVENILTNTDLFLEDRITGRLKAWHLILIVSAGVLIAIITFCCIFRVRVPRTKTEIEANAKRKALLKNFRAKLKSLKSADLDDMDYRKALEKLREEFKADSESLAHSEAISILSLCDD